MAVGGFFLVAAGLRSWLCFDTCPDDRSNGLLAVLGFALVVAAPFVLARLVDRRLWALRGVAGLVVAVAAIAIAALFADSLPSPDEVLWPAAMGFVGLAAGATYRGGAGGAGWRLLVLVAVGGLAWLLASVDVEVVGEAMAVIVAVPAMELAEKDADRTGAAEAAPPGSVGGGG
jgi:hypothetical protein